MRLYSYLYHLVLALFLVALASVALISSNTLKMPMLPWSGTALTQWLLWGGLAGLLSVILAFTGTFRYLFPIWALVVLAIMVRGYVLTPIPFAGETEFINAMLLLAGAFIAFLASLTLFRIGQRRA
jgi:hypothetical protein